MRSGASSRHRDWHLQSSPGRVAVRRRKLSHRSVVAGQRQMKHHVLQGLLVFTLAIWQTVVYALSGRICTIQLGMAWVGTIQPIKRCRFCAAFWRGEPGARRYKPGPVPYWRCHWYDEPIRIGPRRTQLLDGQVAVIPPWWQGRRILTRYTAHRYLYQLVLAIA